MIYRDDIDGLRALAVISVVLFHLGYVANGYLGVDVFFVISGYLITGIIYRQSLNKKFSLLNFYERRIRRIIPLVLFTSLIAFLLGILFMLPDDLENLSQAVFASNFSANNILMYITSSDYWAVKNDFKPLMHTWSLGIEEQFYLLYPLLFFFLKGDKIKYLFPSIIFLTLLSLLAFTIQESDSVKFYFIQYRFFELSAGGMAAIYFSTKKVNYKNIKNRNLLFILIVLLFFSLFLPIKLSNDIKILFVTILTTGILVLGGVYFKTNKIYRWLFSNTIVSFIGKISFSIYMWHQIVFAFYRYLFGEEMSISITGLLLLIIFLLSVSSYFLIENTFRDRKRWKTKNVLIFIASFFVLITSTSFYVYSLGGVVRDTPELNIKFNPVPDTSNLFSSTNGPNIRYNESVRNLDMSFSESTKQKILVVGNSFGRDFVNVLLESDFENDIEIRYFDGGRVFNDSSFKIRVENANLIFFANGVQKSYIKKIESHYNVRIFDKLQIVGIKDFGYSNGEHYFNIRNSSIDLISYRSKMKKGVFQDNNDLKIMWGEKYLDLIGLISDSSGKVLVFTPEGKFISQDTVHFTKDGAVFFSSLISAKLKRLIKP
jgi:peptidoglycan/LPS O-acetylase OafA/YrhL